MSADRRTVDLATFTPPPGWQVEARGGGGGGLVIVSKSAGDSYCTAVVFHSAEAAADLETSFASEWARVALATLDPVATPRVAVSQVGALRVAVGAAASTAQGRPIIGLLFVVDAGARVVSMLVLAPSFDSLAPYRPEMDTILGSLEIRRVEPARTHDAAGSRPTLTIADLAGEWGTNDGIHNGRRITESAKGTVTLSPNGILVLRKPNVQQFVLRGWEQSVDTTVMTLNGPWYEAIPADVLANPAIGANLDQRWVRLPPRQ